ncbi:Junctional adhesion molecule-like [Dissostichus eleginoides]|uniref:Junctional adhesion molecule-like n=1 Tax=Dissostichus eleginoides TaxID=100907 RepID=A0AAD9FAV9_DISEL|nr:Junctional adhesion molecule-like [Dissostichus eleginoides]
MHHDFKVTKLEWTQRLFLYFMVSGTNSLVTVYQPPVLTAALGHDVIMPCQLSLTDDERIQTPPVLYWMFLAEGSSDESIVWSYSENYTGRTECLDNDQNSSNKSILFKNVQWADSGRYLCKLSIKNNNKSFRRKGNKTFLMIYDTMIFNPMVTMTLCSGEADAALPFISLSETVPLRGKGEYECQLHLNKDLVTKSIFHYQTPEPNVMLFPEPWFLYGALLLVPFTILLALITALLMYSC